MVYLDSSAATKLILREPETRALRTFVGTEHAVSSRLLRTEVIRAVRRFGPHLMTAARSAIGHIELINPEESTWELAGMLDPADLRSLGALHLATALELDDEIDALVTYDRRLADAARAHGLAVSAPA